MIRFRVRNPLKVNLNWWASTQKEWAPLLLKDHEKYWKDEKSPSGVPWQKLSPDYERWKKQNYPSEPILRLTGKMEDTAKIVPRGTGFDAKTQFYGIFHQYGTKHMPARPWLGIPDESLERLSEISWKNILTKGKI